MWEARSLQQPPQRLTRILCRRSVVSARFASSSRAHSMRCLWKAWSSATIVCRLLVDLSAFTSSPHGRFSSCMAPMGEWVSASFRIGSSLRQTSHFLWWRERKPYNFVWNEPSCKKIGTSIVFVRERRCTELLTCDAWVTSGIAAITTT